MAPSRLVPAILAPLLLPALPGQCPLSWVPTLDASARQRSLTTLPNGDVLALGNTAFAPDQFARFNGSTWTAIAAPWTSPFALVYPQDFAVLPNGNVVAGGVAVSIGATVVNNIARWNGTSWQAMGTGLPGSNGGDPYLPGWPGVSIVECAPNGDVVAGYSVGSAVVPGSGGVVERWNGTGWQQLGALGMRFPQELLPHANGQVTMAGFGSPEVATWNGSSWVDLGSMTPVTPPPNGPYGSDLVELANGDLVVGGQFTQINPGGAGPNIARWDGASWHSLGSGVNGAVTEVIVLPNGDLFVTGSFTVAGGVPAAGTARWNGTAWSAMPATNDPIRVAVLAGSHLAFAFDDTSPPYFARVATACPGSVSVLGSGCAGQLTAPLPWVGATWTSTGTQLPPVAFVARGFGFATLTLPLSAVSPQAGPGCDLLISPDIVDFVLSTTGTVTTGVPIPNVPALAGSVFHHQLVPFGLDAALNIVSVTSTPALTLTIGTL